MAKAQIAEATPQLKSIHSFDNSSNERQLAQAKEAIYSSVDNISDPILANQMKKGQTESYLSALNNYYNNTSTNKSIYDKEVQQVQDYNNAAERKFANTALSVGFAQKAADEKAAAAKNMANMTSIDNAIKGFTTYAAAGKQEATAINNARAQAEGNVN